MNVYFKTFGCKVNQYETELLRTDLHAAGYHTVDAVSSADVCVVNTCTVTGESDTKCRQMVKKILRDNDSCRIVVTGCFARQAADELKSLSPRIEIVDQDDKDTVPSVISGTDISPKGVLSSFHNHTRAFVKIQDGCDAFCSYCIVPYIRTKIVSRDSDSVLPEIANLIKNGHTEIILTGIRLGRYRSANGYTLSDLLEKIIEMEGDFRVRLSSLEITEVDEKLLDLMESSRKLCRHLHLPLQSGDDDILKKMNRGYTVDEFTRKAEQIHTRFPRIGLTTDVIIGYPGETELQFEYTFNLVNELNFSRLHVFRYSPRSGTKAAGEPQTISSSEIFMRMSIMKVINAILRKRFAEQFIGKTCRVLPEIKKHGTLRGFTDEYIKVTLPPGARENVFFNGTLYYTEETGYALEH